MPLAAGVYFFSRGELARFYLHWIRTVTLPPDARVYVEEGKRKADRFILGPRREFAIDDILSPVERLAAVKECAFAIQHIKKPSAEERLAAVTENGYAIRHIEEPSAEECITALLQNGGAVRFIIRSTQ